MDTVILSEVMKHLDTNDLESFTEAVPESKEVSEDLHFKIQKAILDLEKEFGIITAVNNTNDLNDKYEYKSNYEDNVFKYGNNPYELLMYRRDLINGVIKCNTIEVPISIYNSTASDFDNFDYSINIDDVNSKVLDYVLSKNSKRGDLIHLESYGLYRDNGVLVYDGYKIIIPESTSKKSDYCDIPTQFNVTIEFPPYYFNGTKLFAPHFKLILSDLQFQEIMDSFEYIIEDYGVGYFTQFDRRYQMIFWFDIFEIQPDEMQSVLSDYLTVTTYFEGRVYDVQLEPNHTVNRLTIFCAIKQWMIK